MVLAENLDGAARSLVAEVSSSGGTVLGMVVANHPAPAPAPAPALGQPRAPEGGEVLALGEQGERVTRAGFARALEAAPPRLSRWLDEVDPERTAALVATNFIELPRIADRRVVGARPPRWAAFEDKTTIDEIFARVAVGTPKSTILSARDPDVGRWVRELCSELGCVLALDSSTDYRGDSHGLRWLGPKAEGLDEISRWAGEHADRIRLSRFHEGVPCSVLGMVASTGVAVFDPIEIVTLRIEASRRLVFVGSSTSWRPPAAMAEEIREAGRRVGQELARSAGYRGFFSVDGIAAADGFVATEVNPRLASGLGLRAFAPAFPIYLLARSLQDPEDPLRSLDVAAFEDVVRRGVRGAPSFSLRLRVTAPLRASMEAEGRGTTSRALASGAEYRIVNDTVEIVSLPARGPQEIVGPAVAELARALGWEGIGCYRVVDPSGRAGSDPFALEPRTEAGRRAVALVRSLAPRLGELAVEHDASGEFARPSVELLSREGVLAICAPVSMGGMGVSSLYDICVVLVELGRIDGSLAVAMSMHLALTGYYARIVRTAPPERPPLLQREWLARVGRRAMLVSSAVAEPGRESWRVMTTACKVEGGWSISGEKILVSASPAATHFYTRLRAETPEGSYVMASAMIPAHAPGVTVCDDWQGMGLRGSGSGRVRFENVRIEDAELRLGGVWGVVDRSDFEGRAAASIPIVATYLGMAEAAHDLAVAEARRTGDGPASEDLPIAAQHQLAEIFIAMAEARSVMHCAMNEIDAAFRTTAPRTLDPEAGRGLVRASLIASLVVERTAAKVVDAAMRVVGSRSYGASSVLARIYRDIKAATFMKPYSLSRRYVEFLTRGDLH